jgi:hypothetical protein
MNRFIILVLALLCASTLATTVRQFAEDEFPCELPDEFSDDEAHFDFLDCVEDLFESEPELQAMVEEQCGVLPGEDEEIDQYVMCVVGDEYFDEAPKEVQHIRTIY